VPRAVQGFRGLDITKLIACAVGGAGDLRRLRAWCLVLLHPRGAAQSGLDLLRRYVWPVR
jgi:hypothetical protein